jgi:DNA recombination protein RmuC
MNILASITAVLGFLCAAACALWAMAERTRAVRAQTRADLLEEQRQSGAEILREQAAQSANAVGRELVNRATETFRAQDLLAQAKLEAQLKPVAETLAKFEAHVAAVEKIRAEETGGVKAQIAQMLEATTATREEARKLSAALRRGAGVQGRWGEQMLRNVLEMAGLQARIDFQEQVTLVGDKGLVRPDVVVRMAGGGAFVIDAKCSLNAFLDAQECLDESEREAGYLRHALSVRAHMHSLSAKAYWDSLELSPDFVVMFVPGDSFLAAAVERLPDLYTEAMERRVIVVTPSSLFALCKAVAYGWRVQEQHINAKEIAALGRELYQRLSIMGRHIDDLGKSLGAAVGKYNAFVGSMESRVLSQARKFEELKVDHQAAPLRELAGLEAAVAPLVKLQSVESAALTVENDAPTCAA